MHAFNYAAPGELFCALSISRRSRLTYRRFDSAAKAIRFAIEELNPDSLRAATLEVDERRLDGGEIRRLYDAAAYPLARKSAGKASRAASRSA